MQKYKAKVSASASVELIVSVQESLNGDIEIDEVIEILDVDDLDDVEVKTKF